MKKTKSSLKPVAIVTGAASPLGSAICRKLAGEKMNLVLHYGRSKAKSLELKEELEALGAEVFLVQSNLADPGQTNKLVKQAAQHWGRIDLVVNSASLFEPTVLEKNMWKQWQEIFSINTFSPVGLVIAAKPWLEKNNGAVVNITDIYGEMPILTDHAAYSASKSALIFLTKYLAQALGEKIRVNAVSPGVITFPAHYGETQKKKLAQKSALKRQGKPEEIAQAVWFLVSDKFVTGQILRVDGGRFIS